MAQGVALRGTVPAALAKDLKELQSWLDALGLLGFVRVTRDATTAPATLRLELDQRLQERLLPDFDTAHLAAALDLQTQERDGDLDREILIALLGSPVLFEFPSLAELQSGVHIRTHIARAARKTVLAFNTAAAERPADHWEYVNGSGFILRADKPLVDALRLASQPSASGSLYSFSCYRATEYVILLGIAQELQICNPPLLAALEAQWRRKPIMSWAFHDTFLREYGAMESPLPMRYYVPGDRLWFRNPDPSSSNVLGYEGSWVIYLGGGLFSDFWRAKRTYSLEAKCLEIYHWRHGARQMAEDEWRMDESVVESLVQESADQPEEVARILAQMMRYRDPGGVYAGGGCIDSTREYPRWVCPGTSDLVMPSD